ncbi:MAG: hypothetical protein IM568_08505 [Flavobacterium sp.]|nr:hypothetical protein [Flavobacterium sp.]
MNSEEQKFDKNELKKLAEIANKRRKDARIISLLGIIATLVGLVYSIVYTVNLSKKQVEVLETIQHKEILVDSLENISNQLNEKFTKSDSVKHFINEFLSTVKDENNLDKYYSPKVERYYLRKNVRLDQIKQEKKWHLQDNPRSKLMFDLSDITITEKENNYFEAFVNTLYFVDSLKQPREIIYQLKVNNDMKVFYIRNLEPENK